MVTEIHPGSTVLAPGSGLVGQAPASTMLGQGYTMVTELHPGSTVLAPGSGVVGQAPASTVLGQGYTTMAPTVTTQGNLMVTQQEPVVTTVSGMPGVGSGTVAGRGSVMTAAYPVASVGMPGMVATGTTILAPGSTMMAPGPAGATSVVLPGGAAGSGSMAMSPAMAAMFGGMLKAGSITDDVFNMVDRNQDGVISRSEFRGALKGNIINASATTRNALGR